jgi:hypothetical protein
VYGQLDLVREALAGLAGDGASEALLMLLIALTAFDLGEGRLPSFAVYASSTNG